MKNLYSEHVLARPNTAPAIITAEASPSLSIGSPSSARRTLLRIEADHE